ncbi:MAG: hypothetical protein H0T44_12990 [Gemmatimonadales bacterium]|nr:hypothetical protein [Gemmatimonadales bacterium]
MNAAFRYLVWRSARNRVARQLRQLRQPRYLAALVLGLGYLWIVVLQQRPTSLASVGVEAGLVELLAALAVLGAVLWSWLFGAERRALGFTPAEVTFLFSGPVTRRELIGFKLLKTQLVILLNAILWTVVLSHDRAGLSTWLRAVSVWVLLTTLSLHRLSATFVRTSLREQGWHGLPHRAASLLVVTVVLAAAGWSIAEAAPAIAASWSRGIAEFLGALRDAAHGTVPRALLYPFALAVRPVTAGTPAEWLSAMGPALTVLALHYVWVIRWDAAFEEAAAEASLRRAAALTDPRTGRIAGRPVSRSTPQLLRLKPEGWPGGAIVWKNFLAAVRFRRVRGGAIALGLAGVLLAVLSFYGEGTLAELAGWFTLTWAGVVLVVGPQWVRNDLRNDLLMLDLLRAYPLRGSTVVGAEVMASASVLTALQLSLLLLTFLAFLGNETLEPGLAARGALLLGAVVCLPLLNFHNVLIQNGAALLFPAWVQLGPSRAGGVEALGQSMLLIIGSAVLLSAILLLPLAAGSVVFLALRPHLGLWSLIPAVPAAAGLLALEGAVTVRWLGRVFERTEPGAALAVN